MAEHASLRPSEFVSGGLIDDVNVEITAASFVEWDYQGKIPQPVLAVKVTMQPEDGDEAVDQFYSAGDLKNWMPSKDGKRAVKVGTASSLNNGSNFAQFITSLVNAGFPEDKIADDVTFMVGTQGHVKRVPQPKRSGIIRGGGTEGREPTVLLMTKIDALPGEGKKGKKSTTKKASASTPSTPNASSEEIDGKAVGAVLAVLAEQGGSVSKAKLSAAVFHQLKDDPQRNLVVARAYTDDFLGADGQPWSYDGSSISQ